MVRSRWAPPPMEGKGPREGQRMAIGQYAPPAADEIITPWRPAKPPPPPNSSATRPRLLPSTPPEAPGRSQAAPRPVVVEPLCMWYARHAHRLHDVPEGGLLPPIPFAGPRGLRSTQNAPSPPLPQYHWVVPHSLRPSALEPLRTRHHHDDVFGASAPRCSWARPLHPTGIAR